MRRRRLDRPLLRLIALVAASLMATGVRLASTYTRRAPMLGWEAGEVGSVVTPGGALEELAASRARPGGGGRVLLEAATASSVDDVDTALLPRLRGSSLTALARHQLHRWRKDGGEGDDGGSDEDAGGADGEPPPVDDLHASSGRPVPLSRQQGAIAAGRYHDTRAWDGSRDDGEDDADDGEETSVERDGSGPFDAVVDAGGFRYHSEQEAEAIAVNAELEERREAMRREALRRHDDDVRREEDAARARRIAHDAPLTRAQATREAERRKRDDEEAVSTTQTAWEDVEAVSVGTETDAVASASARDAAVAARTSAEAQSTVGDGGVSGDGGFSDGQARRFDGGLSDDSDSSDFLTSPMPFPPPSPPVPPAPPSPPPPGRWNEDEEDEEIREFAASTHRARKEEPREAAERAETAVESETPREDESREDEEVGENAAGSVEPEETPAREAPSFSRTATGFFGGEVNGGGVGVTANVFDMLADPSVRARAGEAERTASPGVDDEPTGGGPEREEAPPESADLERRVRELEAKLARERGVGEVVGETHSGLAPDLAPAWHPARAARTTRGRPAKDRAGAGDKDASRSKSKPSAKKEAAKASSGASRSSRKKPSTSVKAPSLESLGYARHGGGRGGKSTGRADRAAKAQAARVARSGRGDGGAAMSRGNVKPVAGGKRAGGKGSSGKKAGR